MRMWWNLMGLLLLCLPGLDALAAVYPAQGQANNTLTIYSTTDTAVFDPVLRDFQALHPDITIHYELMDSAPLHARFLRETGEGRPRADLLLSASMDLQVKLVNDGYAAPHESENASALPAWARWRDEAFGFTFEPAVMVFNRRAMQGRSFPQSRNELLDRLRQEPDFWYGRLGTYDISRSSVGYLLASQDARQSSEFGALIEAFSEAQVNIEENTATILDQLESGKLVMGYNLLGSYARARVEAGAPLQIVYPRDYTLVVSRTALVPKNAPNPQASHLFVDYLLSLRGQRVLATRSGLQAIRSEISGPYGRLGIADAQVGLLRPIALGPGLLVYLDQQKRQRLLAGWRSILKQGSK